jgi:hypothetical protein
MPARSAAAGLPPGDHDFHGGVERHLDIEVVVLG